MTVTIFAAIGVGVILLLIGVVWMQRARWREAQSKSQAILRALPDLMFRISPQGVYLDYHAGDERKLLLPPDAFLGKTVREVMPPDLAERFEAKFQAAIHS